MRRHDLCDPREHGWIEARVPSSGDCRCARAEPCGGLRRAHMDPDEQRRHEHGSREADGDERFDELSKGGARGAFAFDGHGGAFAESAHGRRVARAASANYPISARRV